MQNQDTITKTQNKVRFQLGNIYLTVGARETLKESNQTATEFLAKHQSGDWGEVCESDAKENEFSLKEGYRILSSYRTGLGTRIWIITEADRSSTTVLLPSEY